MNWTTIGKPTTAKLIKSAGLTSLGLASAGLTYFFSPEFLPLLYRSVSFRA